jgi:hypothetical protein
MTTSTRLRMDGFRAALQGTGYECSFLHNPSILPHHTANTYENVSTHQFFAPLHISSSEKTGNLLTVPANPLFTARTHPRKVLDNLDTTAVSSQAVARILPPITSVDINQLYL